MVAIVGDIGSMSHASALKKIVDAFIIHLTGVDMLKKVAQVVSLAVITAFTTPAAMAYDFTGGLLASPDNVDYSFNAAATAGTVSFDLLGFNTLDGFPDNNFEDYFTLSVNGSAVFSASFQLGGDGDPITLITGDSSYLSNYVNNGFGAGGSVTITLPVTLVLGANNLSFSYASAIPQGTGDEGWGIRNLSVTTVPEPESYGLLLAGLGLAGFAARRKAAR